MLEVNIKLREKISLIKLCVGSLVTSRFMCRLQPSITSRANKFVIKFIKKLIVHSQTSCRYFQGSLNK